MIYVSYPTSNFSVQENKAYLRIRGDARLSCHLRILPIGKKALPDVQIQAERKGQIETLSGRKTPEGHVEYELFGNRLVMVTWEERVRPKNGRKGNKK